MSQPNKGRNTVQEICEVCGTGKMVYVDHDHAKGLTRGHLCVTCNTAIGMLGDSEERLERALAYLQREHTVNYVPWHQRPEEKARRAAYNQTYHAQRKAGDRQPDPKRSAAAKAAALNRGGGRHAKLYAVQDEETG
jgi:hypothetical protein